LVLAVASWGDFAIVSSTMLRRLGWTLRSALREAHAEMGSLWIALWATLLIAVIPLGTVSGFRWDAETKIVVLTAVISYPITFLLVAGHKAWDIERHGHPHFVTQVDVADASLSIWLLLKDGSPPQAVNELALLVRRRGDRGYGVRLGGVAGTRTINHVGPMPPHVVYPEQFPDAPAVVEPGVWQFIWSDLRYGKRREFLFHEQEILMGQEPTPPTEPPERAQEQATDERES
jgi:hypothetical protein